MMFGGQKFVDLGLGSHRVKCRVHDDFRFVLFVLPVATFRHFQRKKIFRPQEHKRDLEV